MCHFPLELGQTKTLFPSETRRLCSPTFSQDYFFKIKQNVLVGEVSPCYPLYIQSYGKGPNTNFLDAAFKTPAGYIKVDSKCQVVGLEGSVWAAGDASSLTEIKGAAIGKDQVSLVPLNISKAAKGEEQTSWVPSFPMGQVTGPLLVALGHDVEGAFGVGPNLPGCFCSWFCWCCCCAGGPCHAPAGKGPAKMKSDWNNSIFPSVGFGMSADNKNKAENKPYAQIMAR